MVAYVPGQFGDLKIVKELAAARQKRKEQERQRQLQKDAEEAEVLNAIEYEASGSMMECQCCFSDAPMNRVVCCSNDDFHFFCHECIRNLVSNEVGMSRFRVTCMDASGCKALFAKEQLRLVLDKKIIGRLDYMEQQAEIVSANIDGLSECPFCDFKAICPPAEEDREFRCLKPDCEKVSCRLCDEETHIPKSCEEAKKEKGLPARHQIEEAMSEALIRQCPKCKVKIIKEDGCNKMTCTKCGSMMCYVCKKDITGRGRGLGYEHFGGSSGCQVHDERMVLQGLDRHAVEVEKAEKVAIEKARQENPELEELDLKVSSGMPVEKRPPQLGAQYMRNVHNAAGDAPAGIPPFAGPRLRPQYHPPAMPHVPDHLGPGQGPHDPFWRVLQVHQQQQQQQMTYVQQQIAQQRLLGQGILDLEQQMHANRVRQQNDAAPAQVQVRSSKHASVWPEVTDQNF